MTRHRLIRCQMSDVLTEASLRYRPVSRGPCDASVDRWFSWRAASEGTELSWQRNGPGRRGPWAVGWRLELEQGAVGVLAHLSAAPLQPSRLAPPATVSRLILHVWAGRELDRLARRVEQSSTTATPTGSTLPPADRSGGSSLTDAA